MKSKLLPLTLSSGLILGSALSPSTLQAQQEFSDRTLSTVLTPNRIPFYYQEFVDLTSVVSKEILDKRGYHDVLFLSHDENGNEIGYFLRMRITPKDLNEYRYGLFPLRGSVKTPLFITHELDKIPQKSYPEVLKIVR